MTMPRREIECPDDIVEQIEVIEQLCDNAVTGKPQKISVHQRHVMEHTLHLLHAVAGDSEEN
jgi:hypothetical protein